MIETGNEYHIPGYNYLGPGTHIRQRLSEGVQPINSLDTIAQQHDLAYITTDHDIADDNFIGKSYAIPGPMSFLSRTGIRFNKFLRKFGWDFSK